jgi:biopolymer transport protein ExbB/TolQ
MKSDSVKRSTQWFSVLPSLVTPICLGLVFYIGLMAAIQHQVISDETVLRYLMGHPVSKISVAFFFVGFASLLLIGLDILQQFRFIKTIELSLESKNSEAVDRDSDSPELLARSSPLVSQTTNRASDLGKSLLNLSPRCHRHYLWQRIANVLDSIYRNGSASHVEQELKYLDELDVEQQHQRYSFVQILIWATPMLGFLGTVLGISQALGGISVGPDNNFQMMMDGLKSSLYIAFDTTALALTLSMLLMFGQFLIDRFESQLLRVVSDRVHFEIATNFDLTASNAKDSGDVKLEEKLIDALENATVRQIEMWQESLQWAESTLSKTALDQQSHLQKSLSASIESSIDCLARTLGETIDRADQSMTHRWEQWQVILSENARQSEKQQTQFAEQTQAVCDLLKQTAQLASDATKEITSPFTRRWHHVWMEDPTSLQEPVDKASDNLTGKTVPAAPRIPSADFHQWISVSPEFLCEADDHSQVILPITTPISRKLERDHTNFDRDSSPQRRSPPLSEVTLPFLKKSA